MIETIAQYCGYFSGIAAFLVLIFKPIRDWLFGMEDIREGIRCQLRDSMLRTYYKHQETKTIRQYELESFIFQYKAYKRLKGNSFIDKIYKEVLEWEVLT